MTETASAAAETAPASGRRTIARLWQDAVAAKRQTPAYLVERDGGWAEVSWEEADERVRAYANGLLARGVHKGDAFAILAQNDVDWALMDFALAHIGAVGVPIYANNAPRDVGYLLEHSEAVGVVCEDADQLAKVEAVAEGLPNLKHVLTFYDLPGLAAQGRDFATSSPTALDDATAAIGEEDLYTIIYTSGTTGPPKGCMLSHRNYYAMTSVVDSMEDHYRGDDLMLLYLPLAHNFGRLMLLTGALRRVPDRVPARPAPGGRGDAGGAPDRAPERAQGVREGVLRGAGAVRRGDGGEAEADRLGAADRTRGQPAASRGEARPAPARRTPQDRGPARVREGQGAARRPPAHPDLRRRAARARDRRSSSTRSASASSRATG